MTESGMFGAGEDKVAKTQLTNTSQSLQLGSLNEVEDKFFGDRYEPVNGIGEYLKSAFQSIGRMVLRIQTRPQDTLKAGLREIPVCVEVPQSYRNAARYALRMLLLPLGLVPAWRSWDEIENRGGAVYYGDRPPTDDLLVRIPFASSASEFFAARPYELPAHDDHYLFRTAASEPDLVACAFFWLSGWQEYAIQARDEHGRFTYSGSMQERFGTATIPYVDRYRHELELVLIDKGIPVQRTLWNGRSWALAPTHDVDYIRKWHAGSIARSILNSVVHPVGASEMLRGVRDDPFTSSLWTLLEDVTRLGGSSTFLLKAGGSDVRDVAYPLRSSVIRRFVRVATDRGADLGLHPSYHVSTDSKRLRQEKESLSRALSRAPFVVRSHYLRFSLPQTIRLYEKAGFRIDSTLAFPEMEGFRFGTCHPFKLFDIDTDRESDLWEIPLTFMDASLFNRRMLSVDEALERTFALLDVCRKYGGICVGLWHNVVDDIRAYPGWRHHFRQTLRYAHEHQAQIASLSELLACVSGDDHAPSAASSRTTSA